jgi:uncharacterized protein (DUF433 family)
VVSIILMTLRMKVTDVGNIIQERIEVNLKVMLEKPVILGTRITVEMILQKMSEGAKEADLLEAYPRLTRQDIRAALIYGARSLAHETILFKIGE